MCRNDEIRGQMVGLASTSWHTVPTNYRLWVVLASLLALSIRLISMKPWKALVTPPMVSSLRPQVDKHTLSDTIFMTGCRSQAAMMPVVYTSQRPLVVK